MSLIAIDSIISIVSLILDVVDLLQRLFKVLHYAIVHVSHLVEAALDRVHCVQVALLQALELATVQGSVKLAAHVSQLRRTLSIFLIPLKTGAAISQLDLRIQFEFLGQLRYWHRDSNWRCQCIYTLNGLLDLLQLLGTTVTLDKLRDQFLNLHLKIA